MIPRTLAGVLVRVATLVALLSLFLTPAAAQQGGVDSQAELEEKRAGINRLGREEAEVRQRLTTFAASEKELHSEISQLSDLVRESRLRKEELENTISAQNKVIAQQERELKEAEAAIALSRRRIGMRLRRLYRLNKLGGSAALFQHTRLQTLSKDTVYLTMLQEGDRRAIRQYEVLARGLSAHRDQVSHTLRRLEALRDELKAENGQLEERKRYLAESLRNVGKNKKLYGTYLEDLDRMRQEMSEAITRLEKESARRKARPILGNPATLRGTLPLPVAGRIIARFGENDPRYDMKKFQRGLVLEVASKAQVKSVASGRIVHAGAFRGYQSLVVLDHGQGLFSVYGHLERLKVKRGEWVGRERVLGQATYQPIGEIHQVYFEIRYNGEPEDPQHWLKPKAYRSSD